MTTPLRVLVSVDMEGVAGIATHRQVEPDTGGADYATGRRLMTAETNAVIAGILDAADASIIVNDSHGPMDNLIGEDLDDRVRYVVGTPKALSMIEQVQNSDVAMFVGYHAGADSPDGTLAHSYTGSFADIRVNGSPMTEAMLNALVCAQYGVPVLLVTGDEQVCAHAREIIPGVHTLAVKEGIGTTAAVSMTPAEARRELRAAAAHAMSLAGSVAPVEVPDQLHLEVELRFLGAAEYVRLVPGTERLSARTVAYAARSPKELLDVMHAWLYLAIAYRLLILG